MTPCRTKKVWLKMLDELVDKESNALEEALDYVRNVQYRLDIPQMKPDDEKQMLEKLLEEQKEVNVRMCRTFSESDDTVDLCLIPTDGTAASQVWTWAQGMFMRTSAAHQAFLSLPEGALRQERSMQCAECAGHGARDGAVAVCGPKCTSLESDSGTLIPRVESTVPFSTTWLQPHLWNAKDQHQHAQSNQHQWWTQDLKGEARERGSRLMMSFWEGEQYLTARGNTSLSSEAHPRTATFCMRRRCSSRMRVRKKMCPASECEKLS